MFSSRKTRDPSLEKVLREIKSLRKNLTEVDTSDILRYSIIKEAENTVKKEISKEKQLIFSIIAIIGGLVFFIVGDKYIDFKNFLGEQVENSKKAFQVLTDKSADDAKLIIKEDAQRIIDHFRRNAPSAGDLEDLRRKYNDLDNLTQQLTSVKDQLLRDLQAKAEDIEKLNNKIRNLQEDASGTGSLFKVEDRLINLLKNIAEKIESSSRDGSINNIYDPTKIVSASIQEAIVELKNNLLDKKREDFFVYIGTSDAESEESSLKNSRFNIISNNGSRNPISSVSQVNNGAVLEAKSGVRTRSGMAFINRETGDIQLTEEVGVPLNSGDKIKVLERPKPIKIPNGGFYYMAKVKRVNS